MAINIDRNWIVERLSTSERSPERGDHDLNPDYRPDKPLKPAAVLVGLVERDEGVTLLLTRRTDHLEHHPGQVSFPGGHVDPGDVDAIATALRETEEEVGITAEHIDIVGRLDTYVTRTGFEVVPVVAMIRPTFDLTPDPHEVAEVFEVPLTFLLDPANHHRHEREFEGGKRYFYAMPYRDYFIWGATAGMIMDLYQTLVHTQPSEAPA
ncbi:CoA pyrophosphatase [Magnetovibrio sp. PR-2]|uniref:CoA pyrophosphatase n=1 Tax=Magnetovibrio sp. PR-2 TaxID=3120356 RepID=UPI002FCE27AD